MRVYYSCYYDGKECKNAIPKFDDKGNLIPESNDKIKEKYTDLYSIYREAKHDQDEREMVYG